MSALEGGRETNMRPMLPVLLAAAALAAPLAAAQVVTSSTSTTVDSAATTTSVNVRLDLDTTLALLALGNRGILLPLLACADLPCALLWSDTGTEGTSPGAAAPAPSHGPLPVTPDEFRATLARDAQPFGATTMP